MGYKQSCEGRLMVESIVHGTCVSTRNCDVFRHGRSYRANGLSPEVRFSETVAAGPAGNLDPFLPVKLPSSLSAITWLMSRLKYRQREIPSQERHKIE